MVVADSGPHSGTHACSVTYTYVMQTKPDRAAGRDAKERRSHRRESARQEAITRSPQGEKLIRLMSDDPDAINEYGHGGERTRDLGNALRKAVEDGVLMFQRRLGLRSSADPIDVLAVTPSGVWVIDIQSCAGGRVEVSGRQGRLKGHYTHLMIRGRDRTAHLDRLTGQAQAVEETLEELGRSDIPVFSAFCFYDADVQWRRTPELGQARLTTPKRLINLLHKSPRAMSDVEVSAIAQALGQRLPRQHVRD
jgi:hypothetical protein